MRKIGVATDSHCGISQHQAKKLGVEVLPMPFYFNDSCYFEGITIDREEFLLRMERGEKVATSQPSPEDVMDLWRKMLAEYEAILYMPMSSGLSGSCNTAKLLSAEEEFDGRVFVVDNGRIATPMHQSILDALELIDAGYAPEQIRNALEKDGDKMSIYVAVETLEYLKAGGRISGAAAAIGTALRVKPILYLGVGVLDVYKKTVGMKRARREMLELIQRDLDTKFKDSYERGELVFMAASSADEAETAAWVEEIRSFFGGVEVLCDPLSLGITCHAGPGALGVGVSCKPKV